MNFTDAGIACSSPDNCVSAAKGILNALMASKPDAIVVEFGDGVMGEYGVMNLLSDAEIMQRVRCHVLCANDPVGAWGALTFLGDRCAPVDVICGPVTDNDVGKRFVAEKLKCAALNAITDGEVLGSTVAGRLGVKSIDPASEFEFDDAEVVNDSAHVYPLAANSDRLR